MMEEVSMITAYNAKVMDQMSEDEILACLVGETGPAFRVPAMQHKPRKSRLQTMDEEEEPLDKYMRENYRLQQASLRLEQENDSLAHRLIISKVTLRNALDKAEDRVDELTKDLFQARHRLQATEEEKRGREEEAAVSKEVLQRELEKAEREVRRSSGVIADYKQICSQLTLHLERQQAAHREELHSLKCAVKECSRCRHIVESHESSAAAEKSPTAGAIEGQRMTEPDHDEEDGGPKKGEDQEEEEESLTVQIRELEQELAKTKLQMVEAECKIQELEHQKGILANDLQEAKNNWISKAFTSLRTSGGGGLHSIDIPRDGAPAVGWNLHGGPLSGWSARVLAWSHRNNRENV